MFVTSCALNTHEQDREMQPLNFCVEKTSDHKQAQKCMNHTETSRRQMYMLKLHKVSSKYVLKRLYREKTVAQM